MPIVQSKFGGVLTESITEQSGKELNAIETFDQSSGEITKLVHVFFDKGFERDDHFEIMNPVSGDKITKQSKPQHDLDVVPNFFTNNHTSSNQIMMALYRNKRGDDAIGMYTYDTARNVWGKRMGFPGQYFFQNGEPNYAAVDATTNEAVVGYLGRPRYNPHESATFYVMDAATGKHLRSFYGVGYGFPNGMAIDPTTDTMCTTTTGDMDVEFYNLSTGKGKTVKIPILYNKGPLTNGAAVAADAVHHLFLVAQLNSTFSPSGSTVIVYDEHGKLVEYINGFDFFPTPVSVVVPHLAVNPTNRTGYVNGPNPNEIQQFTY